LCARKSGMYVKYAMRWDEISRHCLVITQTHRARDVMLLEGRKLLDRWIGKGAADEYCGRLGGMYATDVWDDNGQRVRTYLAYCTHPAHSSPPAVPIHPAEYLFMSCCAHPSPHILLLHSFIAIGPALRARRGSAAAVYPGTSAEWWQQRSCQAPPEVNVGELQVQCVSCSFPFCGRCQGSNG